MVSFYLSNDIIEFILTLLHPIPLARISPDCRGGLDYLRTMDISGTLFSLMTCYFNLKHNKTLCRLDYDPLPVDSKLPAVADPGDVSPGVAFFGCAIIGFMLTFIIPCMMFGKKSSGGGGRGARTATPIGGDAKRHKAGSGKASAHGHAAAAGGAGGGGDDDPRYPNTAYVGNTMLMFLKKTRTLTRTMLIGLLIYSRLIIMILLLSLMTLCKNMFKCSQSLNKMNSF